MKFIHLADLHLGKKVFGYDLNEEQHDVLSQVLQLADERQVDGVFICGDIFDTAAPTVDAVELFDWFLSELHRRSLDVFAISGNHDSASRIQFGSRIFSESNIHIAGKWEGPLEYADLEKDGERVRIHLLPFIKPGMVRRRLECEAATWSEAIQIALNQAQMDQQGTNILLSHQYYRGAKPCESEVANIGTLDEIDNSCLEPFDYAALGHLHNPQSTGRPQNRYPGTLLKFSASELNVQKSLTLITTHPGQAVSIEEIPITPLRDMIRLQGTFEQLSARDFVRQVNTENYVYIVLDDCAEQFEAFEKLRILYPRILKVEYAHLPMVHTLDEYAAMETKTRTPLEIIGDFFLLQNGIDLDPDQKAIINECLEELNETN